MLIIIIQCCVLQLASIIGQLPIAFVLFSLIAASSVYVHPAPATYNWFYNQYLNMNEARWAGMMLNDSSVISNIRYVQPATNMCSQQQFPILPSYILYSQIYIDHGQKQIGVLQHFDYTFCHSQARQQMQCAILRQSCQSSYRQHMY